MESVYRYVYSCEIDADLKIRVCSLTGTLPRNYSVSPAVIGNNFYVTLSVYCNKRIVGFPVSTSYKPQEAKPPNSKDILHHWGEWITLPIKYSELSRDARIHVELWDVSENMEPRFVGDSTVILFSKRGLYVFIFNSLLNNLKSCFNFFKISEVDRLAKHTKEYNEGLIENVEWLDGFTFSCVEKIKKRKEQDTHDLYLLLEMPFAKYDNHKYAIVYFERDDATDFVAGTSNNSLLTDPEIGFENLCENKHLMMTRNARTGKIDQNLKPNAFIRLDIQIPSTREMSVEQRDLIWKFRYYLKSDKNALVKFVRTVNWEEGEESKQALDLIREWEPVDAADALELLSPAFLNKDVRRYAVSRLACASSEQILMFLPQLVQALKYEAFVCEDMSIVGKQSEVGKSFNERKTVSTDEYSGDDLSAFLVRSACNDPVLANHLYWLLKVEVISTPYFLKFPQLYLFLFGVKVIFFWWMQQKRRTHLRIIFTLSQESGNRTQKELALRKALRGEEFLLNLEGLSLPLDPSVFVKNVIPDSTTLFQSNLMPMKLIFNTVDDRNYVTIFKRGDDLRQDMLVVQMFRLMDKILKADNLDLKFTLYSVLATSISEGFVQFVKATPLRNVVAQYKSIQDFLRSFRPSPTGPYGIETETFDNYVRSCAGYSIVCYILGIGDRHLDNLLLCENGRLFHIDFGFILGRDPKPLPPPMKLTDDMINAMGGTQSQYYQDFRTFCSSAFSILRRQANLILNLFTLMLDADIPDIAIEKEKAVQKIEQRFQFELTEELADQQIQAIIDKSHGDKMSKIVDFIHDVRQMISN
ncbi:unnamed protein product [Enterobius vermicularis]|uniref:Phosphatidylinositol 3-kinase catalytic subunit type 3 n=1 Tax=Enterobius vermicularis TaxID=51028 RepID=A0A0N4UZW5_ENTVE|nr:unnamed protein product [Enterobius vermicularis]